MLTKLARRALAAPRRVPGYVRFVRRLRSRALAIVMYHGVIAEPLPVFNWCQLAAAEFARQAALLAQEYRVLPLSEVISRLEQRAPLPERAACITFDDGFRNVLTTACPILQRHQLPATVFLVTGAMGTGQPAWTDRLFHALLTTSRGEVRHHGRTWPLSTPGERSAAYKDLTQHLKQLPVEIKDEHVGELAHELGRPEVPRDSALATLNWEEVDALRATGLVEFGSHTHTHPVLSRCSPARQEHELRASRDVLRVRLGRADLFAYPNGSRADFTPTTQDLLRRLGYRCGVTTIPGLNRAGQDLYELCRVHVGADTSFAQFELRLLGL
jgi:peptidoglycan/xylan/chitin deacetylase (PgdA/CDA1 family)